MKKTRSVCLPLLLVTLAVMGVNAFAASLPDWAVRTAGVGMLAALAVWSFAAVRLAQEKKTS